MLFNRLVRRNFHREMRENRESLYGLLFLVRTLPVVRGSWNLKGVSPVIFTAKRTKSANKKRSVPNSPVVIFTAKCTKTAKTFLVSFSSFVAFLFFAVNVSNRGVRNNYNRERRENREKFL